MYDITINSTVLVDVPDSLKKSLMSFLKILVEIQYTIPLDLDSVVDYCIINDINLFNYTLDYNIEDKRKAIENDIKLLYKISFPITFISLKNNSTNVTISKKIG